MKDIIRKKIYDIVKDPDKSFNEKHEMLFSMLGKFHNKNVWSQMCSPYSFEKSQIRYDLEKLELMSKWVEPKNTKEDWFERKLDHIVLCIQYDEDQKLVDEVFKEENKNKVEIIDPIHYKKPTFMDYLCNRKNTLKWWYVGQK